MFYFWTNFLWINFLRNWSIISLYLKKRFIRDVSWKFNYFLFIFFWNLTFNIILILLILFLACNSPIKINRLFYSDSLFFSPLFQVHCIILLVLFLLRIRLQRLENFLLIFVSWSRDSTFCVRSYQLQLRFALITILTRFYSNVFLTMMLYY